MLTCRHPAHYLAGFITGAAALVGWALVVVGAGLFCLYELVQAKSQGDKPHLDIREFVVGYFIATGGLIAWTVLSRWWL